MKQTCFKRTKIILILIFIIVSTSWVFGQQDTLKVGDIVTAKRIPRLKTACSGVVAHTPLSIKEKAAIYYKKLNKRYNDEGRKYNLEYLDKYGYPPPPSEFPNKFYTKLLNDLKDLLAVHTTYNDNSLKLIEEKLLIWEFWEGCSIPNSTFLTLMNTYYKIAPDKAINFCISRWELIKHHKIDRTEFHEIPWIKNYPYLVFIFDNLSLHELLNVFLIKNNLSKESNEKFIDLCFKELRYNKTKEEIQMIKNYIISLQHIINKDKKLNSYFLKKINNL